jgi:hypothetical protein
MSPSIQRSAAILTLPGGKNGNNAPVETGDGGGHSGGMEARVARLEADMADVKAVLARLEPMIVRIDATMQATLPTLATKAELADKPGKGYLWGILAALLAAYASGLAALALLK